MRNCRAPLSERRRSSATWPLPNLRPFACSSFDLSLSACLLNLHSLHTHRLTHTCTRLRSVSWAVGALVRSSSAKQRSGRDGTANTAYGSCKGLWESRRRVLEPLGHRRTPLACLDRQDGARSRRRGGAGYFTRALYRLPLLADESDDILRHRNGQRRILLRARGGEAVGRQDQVRRAFPPVRTVRLRSRGVLPALVP